MSKITNTEMELQKTEWNLRPIYLEGDEALLSYSEYVCRRETCKFHSNCACAQIKLKHKTVNPQIGYRISNTTYKDKKKTGKFLTLFCKTYKVRE